MPTPAPSSGQRKMPALTAVRSACPSWKRSANRRVASRSGHGTGLGCPDELMPSLCLLAGVFSSEAGQT